MRNHLHIIFYFTTIFSFSQVTYKGTVYFENDSLPLPGVSVNEIYTKNYTTTDFNGNFILESNTNKLKFQYLGMITKEITINENENIKIFLKEDKESLNFYWPTHRNLWFTVGTYSDIRNAPFGISIGNGIEEENHLHFEDHTHLITYNFFYANNFENKNQTYGGKVRLTYIKGLKEYSSFLEPTIEYSKKDYANINFEHFTFSSNIYYLKSINLTLNAKVGYQKFNIKKNYGFVIGMNRLEYGNYNLGINIGYWNDYFTYEPYISKFIYKRKIIATVNYQNINNYSFFNLKVNYLFSLKKKIKRK